MIITPSNQVGAYNCEIYPATFISEYADSKKYLPLSSFAEKMKDAWKVHCIQMICMTNPLNFIAETNNLVNIYIYLIYLFIVILFIIILYYS